MSDINNVAMESTSKLKDISLLQYVSGRTWCGPAQHITIYHLSITLNLRYLKSLRITCALLSELLYWLTLQYFQPALSKLDCFTLS